MGDVEPITRRPEVIPPPAAANFSTYEYVIDKN